MTAPAKTAAPARKRTSAPVAKKTAAPAKSTAAPAEAPEAEVAATEPVAQKTTVQWEHVETTKGYEKFKAPAGAGCVGNVYAPLGTKVVKVLFVE